MGKRFTNATAAYFATCDNTPFYLSNASSSVHIKPPFSLLYSNPSKISSLSVGSDPNYWII